MDIMELRRGLLMQMAGGAKVKTGTFTGDGTIVATLNVGFEPDIVIINCDDLDLDTQGWFGLKNVVIVKNMISYGTRHNNTSASSGTPTVTDNLGGSYPAYGETTGGDYHEYGSYSNGIFTVSNTNDGSRVYFINNQTYNWFAIKLP